MNLFVLLLISLPVFLGVLSLLISCAPFEFVKTRLDAFTVDGDVYFFTEPFFKNVILKLRLVGIAFILVGSFIILNRPKIKQYLLFFLEEMTSCLRNSISCFDDFIKTEGRLHLFILLAIVLLGTATRIFFLSVPMRYDEAYTFTEYASKPFYIVLSNYSSPNNHVFHTLLVRMSYLILGNHPWVLRLPALLAGVFTIPAAYGVIRVFYNKHASLLTAAFVASSSILIDYSTNARGYSLMVLFFLLLLALSKYLKDHENISGWFFFVLLSALGFYTLPTMWYAFGGVAAWILSSALFKDTKLPPLRLARNLGIASLSALLLTLLFYLPVLVGSGARSLVGNDYVTVHSWPFFTHHLLLTLNSTWDQWTRDLPFSIEILLTACFFVSLTRHRRLTQHRIPVMIALAAFLVPFLMFHRTIGADRSWLFLLPFALGVASSGLVYLFGWIRLPRQPLFIPVLSFLLCCLLSWNLTRNRAVYYSNESGAFRSANDAALFFKNYLKPGDRILSKCPTDAPLEYYFLLHGLPKNFLYSNVSTATRFLAVVHRQRQQTLEDVLKNGGVSTDGLTTAKMIQQFPEAILYELERRQ